MPNDLYKPAYLNVGCGARFHNSWTNIDLAPHSPEVKRWDARHGLPFPDRSFDACYSSHVFEHLAPDAARRLLAEMHRVLKSDGIARIVVPDLEAIARTYLEKLGAVCAGAKNVEADYDWMMLELYDQTVRTEGGGEMARYLAGRLTENEPFVVSRAGEELVQCVRAAPAARPFWQRVRAKPLSSLIRTARLRVAEMLVLLAAGKSARSMFKEGIFRQSGEIHRWMYDRFSLGRLFSQAGFSGASVCRPDQSLIPNFNACELDMQNGKVRKPDSLFMEARKT